MAGIPQASRDGSPGSRYDRVISVDSENALDQVVGNFADSCSVSHFVCFMPSLESVGEALMKGLPMFAMLFFFEFRVGCWSAACTSNASNGFRVFQARW